jgi:hypothetical protein
MRISLTSNIAQLRRIMQREQRSQLPFATARALTMTGQDARADLEPHIDRAFDRPTRFTRNSVATQPATRTRLYSRVLIKDAQAAYLGLQEEGGTRTPARTALVVPVEARLNQYGNMPRGYLRRLLSRSDTFSGNVKGIGGIWQRTRDGGVKLIVAYAQRAQYQPRFGMKDRVERTARERFPPNFERAFREAMETAR